SRQKAFRAGLSLAVAAVVSGFVSLAMGPSSVTATIGLNQWLRAWQHDLPILVTYLAAYGIAELAIESVARPKKPASRPVSTRFRAGITLVGFAPLALISPAAAVFGLWSFLPLAIALAIIGLLVHRAVEVSTLKRQLSVSQAMGLASLADAATAEPTALLY